MEIQQIIDVTPLSYQTKSGIPVMGTVEVQDNSSARVKYYLVDDGSPKLLLYFDLHHQMSIEDTPALVDAALKSHNCYRIS